MQAKIKAGSPFLFSLIRLLTFVYALTGLALLGVSIWLWFKFDKFSPIELAFIFLGIFEMLLVLLACTAKKSKGRLRLFMFLMAILFLLEFTAAIIVFAIGDKIIDDIVNKADSKEQWDQMKKYLFIANWVVIGTLLVQLVLILLVKCYIGSLRSNNNEYDYKVLDDDGNKISLQQKQQKDKEIIHDKYNAKREEMRAKYGQNYDRN